jgi:hypothetical protein
LNFWFDFLDPGASVSFSFVYILQVDDLLTAMGQARCSIVYLPRWSLALRSLCALRLCNNRLARSPSCPQPLPYLGTLPPFLLPSPPSRTRLCT